VKRKLSCGCTFGRWRYSVRHGLSSHLCHYHFWPHSVSITYSLFHSRLKTYVFNESFLS